MECEKRKLTKLSIWQDFPTTFHELTHERSVWFRVWFLSIFLERIEFALQRLHASRQVSLDLFKTSALDD